MESNNGFEMNAELIIFYFDAALPHTVLLHAVNGGTTLLKLAEEIVVLEERERFLKVAFPMFFKK